MLAIVLVVVRILQTHQQRLSVLVRLCNYPGTRICLNRTAGIKAIYKLLAICVLPRQLVLIAVLHHSQKTHDSYTLIKGSSQVACNKLLSSPFENVLHVDVCDFLPTYNLVL